MKNNSFSLSEKFPEDFKNQNFKHTSNKFEYDLYHDEDNKIEKIIRIKRIFTSDRIEKWKIFDDNKLIFTIEGKRLNEKERKFLRTVSGVNLLISYYKKIGHQNLSLIREEIKKNLK